MTLETDIHGDAWVARIREQHDKAGTACPCGHGATTDLALPFKPLTLDGLVCIHPECMTCRALMAYDSDAILTSESWGEAVP